MPQGDAGGIARRTFLVGVGASAALTLTGCSLFGGTTTTRTVTQEAPPPVDPLLTLIATTRLHLARLDAALPAVAADPVVTATLTSIRADRAAHLEALLAEQLRTDPGAANSSAVGSAPSIAMPADVAAILALVRADTESAQVQFTDGVSATGRYRAALFGSIAACLATHRSVLV